MWYIWIDKQLFDVVDEMVCCIECFVVYCEKGLKIVVSIGISFICYVVFILEDLCFVVDQVMYCVKNIVGIKSVIFMVDIFVFCFSFEDWM